MAVIVAGTLYVDPGDRGRFIQGHRNIVEQARKHPGCLDLSISPDPTEAGRVNVFEYWESKETLDTWRAMAPSPTVSIDIQDDQAVKHEISKSGPPFD